MSWPKDTHLDQKGAIIPVLLTHFLDPAQIGSSKAMLVGLRLFLVSILAALAKSEEKKEDTLKILSYNVWGTWGHVKTHSIK